MATNDTRCLGNVPSLVLRVLSYQTNPTHLVSIRMVGQKHYMFEIYGIGF